MEKVIKTFISEIKSVNEKDFTLEAVVSDETIDRYGEVIKIDAWKKRLGRYKAMPVLLSSHRYDKLTNQIGKAEKIKIEDGKLVAKFKYFHGEGNDEADWAWKLASKFGMAAYSVGFLPYKAEDKEYDEDVKSGKKACREYTDVELLEVSQVLIPANPSAMMKSFEDEEDEVVKEYIEMVQKEFISQEEPEFVELVQEDLEVKDVEDEIETKPDTENYVHIAAPGQEGKHSGHEIKTIAISSKEGIKAHYCVGCKKITGYMFDKSKGWTHEKAAKWVEEHNKAYDFFMECGYLEIGDITTFPGTEKEEIDKDCVMGLYFFDINSSIAIKTFYEYKDEINDVILGKKKKPCGPKGKSIEEEEMNEIMEKLVSLEAKMDAIIERYNEIDMEDAEFLKSIEEIEQQETEDTHKDEENYIKSLLEESINSVNKALSSVQQK